MFKTQMVTRGEAAFEGTNSGAALKRRFDAGARLKIGALWLQSLFQRREHGWMERGNKIDACSALFFPTDEAFNRLDARQLDPKPLPDLDAVNQLDGASVQGQIAQLHAVGHVL